MNFTLRCRVSGPGVWATWAQALTPGASTDLFNIEKVAADVYFTVSKPTMLLNCNAAIFVNSRDVTVVDAHSKPSTSAALLAQIKKDITPKPVRYLVDTHFYWDHAQGNAAYRAAGAKVVASKATRDLLAQNTGQRLHSSLDPTTGWIRSARNASLPPAPPRKLEVCNSPPLIPA
ncbi:MAG: MBL fold metallo-hydrolase [Bryobacterales bacterium]|nr:MBL fold metallo-hydrolase [Bryobacterales bacterium]